MGTIVRKKFKWESAHRVHSSTGSRCKNTIHGHSYITEIWLKNDVMNELKLDMVIDFGDLKSTIGEFMDSLDHTTFIWRGDDIEYLGFIRKYSKRVVMMYKDPTAENIAKATMKYVSELMRCSHKTHAEVIKVRVHETRTGYAEVDSYTQDDVLYLEHDNVD